ncbi:MAG: PaaI family thioesterase [Parvibaculum sedimenti]|uniref:PaaI family thioesterase n=1 Tax=Parvibaculum sedimenti TaxID=2608632 RepID=UPI003BB527C6
MSDVPPGFAPVQSKGFGGFTGPVYRGHDAKGEVFIFDVAAQHLNGGDRLHGGMMMTLASMVLGEAAKSAAEKSEPGADARALSLNCDFVSAGERDERVECRATITRATRSVLFIAGELCVGSRILMSATGVYAIKRAEA